MSIVRTASVRLVRGAASVLALLATSLIVLQPVCAAVEPPGSASAPVSLAQDADPVGREHHDSSGDPCCASLEAAPVGAAATAPSGPDERSAVVSRPAHALQRLAAPGFFTTPALAASSLPPLRYYVRSARILR